MDGQTMFDLGRVIFLSVAAFIVITMLCWKNNVAAFKGLAAWFRSLPRWWRMQRDPVFRREQECIAVYQMVAMAFYACRGRKNRLREQLENLVDRNSAADRRLQHELSQTLDDLEVLRGHLARHIAGLEDEDIVILALWLSREATGGLVTPEEAAVFLKEERELLRSHPVMAVNHLERQIRFFAPLYQTRQAAGQDQPRK
ncbi:MAG: hypothetical protein WCT10_04260 [Patescibacteria group bacterium]|jgi:hypothetical protein